MNPIRILVADDHPVFRFGLRALLNAMPDTQVIGEVTNGAEVIALAGSLQPDVILMDINMPGVNGIEATRRIRETNPDIRILMVTMLEDDSVFAAMRAGARGYVVKGAEPTEVLRAIRAVADGEAIFSPGVAERVIHYFATPPAAAQGHVKVREQVHQSTQVRVRLTRHSDGAHRPDCSSRAVGSDQSARCASLPAPELCFHNKLGLDLRQTSHHARNVSDFQSSSGHATTLPVGEPALRPNQDLSTHS